jgi:hypothetical protein
VSIFLTLSRWFLAVFASCVVSLAFVVLASIFYTPLLMSLLSMIPTSFADPVRNCFGCLAFIQTGFAAVLTGTLCLEKPSRRLGSIFLLGVVLIFYMSFWIDYIYKIPPIGDPDFWPLACGSLAAVTCFCWRKPGVMVQKPMEKSGKPLN